MQPTAAQHYPPDFRLAGKIAVITGASRGIGLAIAQTYASAGAAVVLAGRRQASLDSAAAQIRAAGGEALGVAAHTGEQEAVERLMAEAAATYGGVDILVNNAATSPHFGPLLEATESQWDKTLDVNLKGYVRTVQAAVPTMRARGGGKILNIASIAGKTPLAGLGVYSVSKAAVLMLTEVLAVELAPAQIQVNAIAPGFVKTQFSSALWGDAETYRRLIARVPQQRLGEASEIAGLALYLVSSASAYVTGATFVVDGGQLVGAGGW